MNKKFFNAVCNFCEKYQEKILVLISLILSLFLMLYHLTPKFVEINPHDGVKYIESGRQLLIWGLRDLSWGPLVAFVFAPIHLIVGQSQNWFLLEAWIGNIILFILMWVSFYMLARQLKPYISKYVFIGLLFSWVFYYRILFNQSDALLLPLSVFAFINILRYRQNQKIKNIWYASLFVGLCMLTRVETLILIIPLLFFSIFFNHGKHNILHIIISAIAPFAIIFLTFVTVSYITHGHSNLSMAGKSFFSYTHPLVQNFLPGSKNELAYLRGEPIFGTPEQNQGSVFRTILINPSVLFERVLANLLDLPDKLSDYYGIFNRWVLVIFSVLGGYSLIRSKDWQSLMLLLVWPAHALVTLIFESLHFIPQTSYFLLIFSGIGITKFLSKQADIKEKMMVFGVSLVILVFSLLRQYQSLLIVSVFLAIVFFVNIFIKGYILNNSTINLAPVLILFIGVFAFRPSFVFPNLIVGQSEDEKAVHFLIENFPTQSDVLAYIPRSAVAAKMHHRSFPTDINDHDEFLQYLVERKIDVIFYDRKYPFPHKIIEEILENYPETLELEFRSDSGSIIIYSVSGSNQRN